MAERPILMSAPMVRATLDDLKTHTRRGITRLKGFGQITDFGPSDTPGYAWTFRDRQCRWHDISHERLLECCPHGQPGDRLWVRETWMPDPPRDGTWPHVAFDGCKPHDMTLIPGHYRAPRHCLYRADGHKKLTGWTPAIHMFRWASRISLEITSVRVERLQDIGDDDLEREGLQEVIDAGVDHDGTPRDAWRALWTQINGHGSWASNPLVWVVEFRRVQS